MRNLFYFIVLLGISGCVLAPRETKNEQKRLDQAGRPFEKSLEDRHLPDLPDPVTWQAALQRAFLANGDLEAAFFDWSMAMSRIPQRAGWPNTNVSLGYSYQFNSERMKSFNRQTFSAGFDPMLTLSLPFKTAQAGKIALAQAQSTGWRFHGAKFDLQKRVLTAYLDIALMDEKIRIQSDNLSLLKLLTENAEARLQAGGMQSDLLKAQIEYRMAENELATMKSQRHAMAAMLNAMLARRFDAPLELPKTLPAPRTVTADDSILIASAVNQNPELGALAREVQGRTDAIELAKMAYYPDIAPSFSFTGNVSQMVGVGATIPTTFPQIAGAVDEAKASLRQVQAMARQTHADRAAAFVGSLYALRNAERQAHLFDSIILPKSQQAMSSVRQAYASGSLGFIELVEAQRTLLQVRTVLAEARIEREKKLAEMEALAGVDVETLGGPTTQPTTAPTQPATEPTEFAPVPAHHQGNHHE